MFYTPEMHALALVATVFFSVGFCAFKADDFKDSMASSFALGDPANFCAKLAALANTEMEKLTDPAKQNFVTVLTKPNIKSLEFLIFRFVRHDAFLEKYLQDCAEFASIYTEYFYDHSFLTDWKKNSSILYFEKIQKTVFYTALYTGNEAVMEKALPFLCYITYLYLYDPKENDESIIFDMLNTVNMSKLIEEAKAANNLFLWVVEKFYSYVFFLGSILRIDTINPNLVAEIQKLLKDCDPDVLFGKYFDEIMEAHEIGTFSAKDILEKIAAESAAMRPSTLPFWGIALIALLCLLL